MQGLHHHPCLVCLGTKSDGFFGVFLHLVSRVQNVAHALCRWSRDRAHRRRAEMPPDRRKNRRQFLGFKRLWIAYRQDEASSRRIPTWPLENTFTRVKSAVLAQPVRAGNPAGESHRPSQLCHIVAAHCFIDTFIQTKTRPVSRRSSIFSTLFSRTAHTITHTQEEKSSRRERTRAI